MIVNMSHETLSVRYDQTGDKQKNTVQVSLSNGTYIVMTSEEAYYLIDMLDKIEEELECDLGVNEP